MNPSSRNRTPPMPKTNIAMPVQGMPVQITEMPDRVVWVPMRGPGSEVRSVLGSAPGSVVTLSVGSHQ